MGLSVSLRELDLSKRSHEDRRSTEADDVTASKAKPRRPDGRAPDAPS